MSALVLTGTGTKLHRSFQSGALNAFGCHCPVVYSLCTISLIEQCYRELAGEFFFFLIELMLVFTASF